ncbi:MAG: CDP-alcohol phosphatidyltransferase family protein, partial [Desulfuromonadales bacterium]
MTRLGGTYDSRKSLKRGVYLLPNLVTTGGLFAGFYGIVATMKGDYHIAAWFILISAIFDALDGKVARLTGTTSQFGVEYDSLADIVSFGVAPGLLMYS